MTACKIWGNKVKEICELSSSAKEVEIEGNRHMEEFNGGKKRNKNIK